MEYEHFTFAPLPSSHEWKAWEKIALFGGIFLVAAAVWYGE